MDVKLRLVQFESEEWQRVGVELEAGGRVVDVTAVDPTIPTDMRTFLHDCQGSLTAANRSVLWGTTCLSVCLFVCLFVQFSVLTQQVFAGGVCKISAQ